MNRSIFTIAAIAVAAMSTASAQIAPIVTSQVTYAVEIPSGQVPGACKVFLKDPRRVYSLLNCYLSDPSNANVAGNIQWYFAGNIVPWANWPGWAKQELADSFGKTVTWYQSGMSSYPGVLPQDPLFVMNEVYLKNGGPGGTVFDEVTVARPIYLGHVAMSLAAEIYGWVPWSLKNFTDMQLYLLYRPSAFFWPCNYGVAGFCTPAGGTPTNAVVEMKFLKQNNLIGKNKAETIVRVLGWARRNLWHTGGGSFTYDVMFQYFGYYGAPPVSRILQGTVITDPATPDDWKINPHHWTAGCLGTSVFLPFLVRAINIPADQVAAGGGHISVSFPSEGLYMSHGDDPYAQDMRSDAPDDLLPINKATYDLWFPASEQATTEKNTGRRTTEINLQYPGEYTMNLYCKDVNAGTPHDQSLVFTKYYGRIYTLAQMDFYGVWDRLDQKLATYACPQ